MDDITSFSSVFDKRESIEKIRKIFFDGSSKEFSNESEKDHFFEKWTSPYFSNFPQYFYLFHRDSKCIAYCSLCPDSKLYQNLFSDIPSYTVFEDMFDSYPAHLHINTDKDYRGLGIGKKLLEEIFSQLKKNGIKGVHIVTSPEQRNTSFYSSLGFSYTLLRDYKNTTLLFMGKSL